jgi:hypothetical protein
MKRFAAFLLLLSSQAFAQSVVPVYGPTKSPRYTQLQDGFRTARVLEQLAASLSSGIRLPTPIQLSTAECGTQNAFYNRGNGTIVVCLELVESMIIGIGRERSKTSTPESIDRAAAGAFMFVLLHEFGHALIHALNLPVLGREEDAADQISTFFLLNGSTREALFGLDGAMWFFRDKSLFYTRQHFGGEHSLDPQRRINLACWAYGKDPNMFRWVVSARQLPPDRAVRCAREYAQLDYAVRALLGSYVTFPAK